MSLATKSNWDRAKRFIPNGCQTLSKGPDRYVDGVYPKLLSTGHGCIVIDEDGKEYTDYISALGAIILGYNNLAVDDAVKESINCGEVLLSLPHPKEGLLAEKLSQQLGVSKIKFFKTGSEATSAAVRVARAYTGRDLVLMCGYNGWHDWAAITYDRQAGVPVQETRTTGTFVYNEIESLEACFKNLGPAAAVILEPVIYEEPRDVFLDKVISTARKYGALVICDEIVTGLRFGATGASGLLGIKPDIICMGKALGNGYAISVLGGDDEVMSVFERDDFIASGTFSGELVGISAAIAVLERLNAGHIWRLGALLKTGFNNICHELEFPTETIKCVGYAPRTKFSFHSDTHKALFWQECVKRGILFGHANFVTQAHTDFIIKKTLDVCYEALNVVKKNWDDPLSKLEGKMPKQVMR